MSRRECVQSRRRALAAPTAASGAGALGSFILCQAPQRVVHLPRETLDLAIELLELDDWIMGPIFGRLGFGLKQGSAERGGRDRQRELAAVIFTAVPHHRGLHRTDLWQ